ncbi:MAG TPA: metallophosphoesterase [bacterium]|nr:metallophosphoesterase [bacterium]
MSKKIPTKLAWIIFWLIAALIASWLNYQNRHLVTTTYQIKDSSWPEILNGWRLVQLSDLHNQATYGPGNKKIIATIKNLKPHAIVLTGDTFDGRSTNISANLSLITALKEIAPVYYITGNHEFSNDDYLSLVLSAQEAGATTLRDEIIPIEECGATINIIGLDDPSVLGYPIPSSTVKEITERKLHFLESLSNNYPTIILAHRPELWSSYLTIKPLAIFSGHTHGGQLRLPFIGSTYVPNQKLFTKYDRGLFHFGQTSMIINQGIGNSTLEQRLLAYPEIVSVDFFHQ